MQLREKIPWGSLKRNVGVRNGRGEGKSDGGGGSAGGGKGDKGGGANQPWKRPTIRTPSDNKGKMVKTLKRE